MYLWRAHGRHNFLGGLYLNSYCGIRIVADIVSLLPSNRNSPKPKESTIILSSVGLSPLILTLAGFSHYIHYLLLQRQDRQAGKPPLGHKKYKLFLWFVQIQIHFVSAVGIIITILGAIKMLDPQHPLTETEFNHAKDEWRAGALILCILWAAITQYIVWLFFKVRRIEDSGTLRSLAFWTTCATPLIGAKMIYTVVYVFDYKDLNLNPAVGSLWVKIVFVWLLPMFAIGYLLVGLWLNRPAKRGDIAYSRVKREKAGNMGQQQRPLAYAEPNPYMGSQQTGVV